MSYLNVLRQWVEALKIGWNPELQSGEALKLIPLVDGQGSLEVGNGTKDMDAKIFMGGAGAYVLFDESATQLVLSGVTLIQQAAVVAETTTSRTVTAADFGKTIKLSNASACTVTLPASVAGNLGAKVKVLCITDAAHIVALTNGIIAPATLTSDSLTAAETSKVGQWVELESDGAGKWFVTGWTGDWTVAA